MGGLKDRLIEFITHLGIDKATFEKRCGLSNGFVDKSGENTRTSSLDKISNTYPELSIPWLRNGTGEMLKKKRAIQQSTDIMESEREYFSNEKPTTIVQIMINERRKYDENISELISQNKELLSQNRELIEIIRRQTELLGRPSTARTNIAGCADAG